MKINCIRPGLYEIQEKGMIYKMEIIWLSRFQREVLNFENSDEPVGNWYNNLDEKSRAQIKVRSLKKAGYK